MRTLHFDADGVRLHAVEQGAGPLMVLFHGGGATHHALLPLAGELAPDHRVITPDLRGSGRSWCAAPLTWDRLADDVAALRDRVGAGRAIVGGPSMGAAVALRFALRHPDRVAALVMLAPACGGAEFGWTEFQINQLAGLDRVMSSAGDKGFDALRQFYQASPAMAAYFDANVGDWDLASFRATTAFMAGGAQPFERAADLAVLDCPTLVIPGDDPMHPAEVAALIESAIPGCVTRPAPNGGAANNKAIAIEVSAFCAVAARW